MPKRSRKRANADPNLMAKAVIDAITGELPDPPKKNPAAVALGHLGGLKGGKARAEKLSKKRKSEIAKKAAEVRWRSS
jgi:hypothetical protein